MQTRIVQTADGSSSVFVPKFDELYHSVNGAITESNHVYINSGLKHNTKQTIKVFEMGYGTGLNFILSFIQSENKKIEYHALEAYPLDLDVIKQLNYPESLKLTKSESKIFYDFHKLKEREDLAENFSVVKHNCLLKDYSPKVSFDVIYFDAFGPDAQPELWTLEVFEKLFKMMNPGGILTTYCSKGDVRRNMLAAGFKTEKLPGPPGKREILRAIKQ